MIKSDQSTMINRDHRGLTRTDEDLLEQGQDPQRILRHTIFSNNIHIGYISTDTTEYCDHLS
jgi:hypothetical protein